MQFQPMQEAALPATSVHGAGVIAFPHGERAPQMSQSIRSEPVYAWRRPLEGDSDNE